MTEYSLLFHSNGRELSNIVNHHLKQGWELYGSPVSTGNGLYQAVIREVENRGTSVPELLQE